jgi:tetratricopeptide (TPR) repeat protein
MRNHMHIRIVVLAFIFLSDIAAAQINSDFVKINEMLLNGKYAEVVHSTLVLLEKDSLNPDLHYKLALAYQNLMLSDKALKEYKTAAKLQSDNKVFLFSLAKQYYLTGKMNLAEPIFIQLYQSDSTNWLYGYYLAEFYLQQELYDKSMSIYNSVYHYDTTNYVVLDKTAYCWIKLENNQKAIDTYKKSLEINKNNIVTIKSLSLILKKLKRYDSALYYLNKGITIDSSDLDLYLRRADVYYALNYHRQAREDYMRILRSGDTTAQVLKKIGLGYQYAEKYKNAEKYLYLSYLKDTTDYELCRFLGSTYNELKEYEKSVLFYEKSIQLLTPTLTNINKCYFFLAINYYDRGEYSKAIEYYKKSLNMVYDPGTCLQIARIYDEKLNNYGNAIIYYQRFMDEPKTKGYSMAPGLIDTVEKRLDWLKKNKR